ncbi:MAG TPA: hypothetical protein VGO22_11015 [Pseudorhizobium sp.]|nr:hypothetical protein [Pseudorhizobium sp.]
MTLDQPEPKRRSTPLMLLMAALAIVGVLIGANAHLVYVAFASQPDCVAHLKTESKHGGYRAAKSAC